MTMTDQERLDALLAKVAERDEERRAQEVQRAVAERDLAAANKELLENYGVSSFEDGLRMAAELKSAFQAKLAELEEALAS